MKEIKTEIGKTYAVTSATGCTVYRADGVTVLKEAQGGQDYFVAVERSVTISDDTALVTETFNAAPQQKLTLLGVLGGNADSLPAGYKRVEWLESAGDANILLPFSGNRSPFERVEITEDIQFLEKTRTLVGFKGTSGFFWGSSSDGFFELSPITSEYLRNEPFTRYAVTYNVEWRYFELSDKITWVASLKINDDFRARPSEPSSLPIEWKYGLFALAETDGYRGKVRLWSCRGRQGEVQYDLIPALDETGTPCMFDKVSKTAFYNSGTGDFTYPTESTTYSLRRVLPDWGKLTEHGLRRLYHAPANYAGELCDYALEHGYKPLVEPEKPEDGYWSPQWRETEDEIVLEWVETEAPEDEFLTIPTEQ